MTNWSVVKVTVSCCVHFDDEHKKEHVETQAVHSNEATSVLALMVAEAAQGISTVGDMETIPDQNFLPIQWDDGETIPMDWSKWVIAHADLPTNDWVVWDKYWFVG
jgi:hypothetical protein